MMLLLVLVCWYRLMGYKINIRACGVPVDCVVILIHYQIIGILGGLVFFLEIPASNTSSFVFCLCQCVGKLVFWKLIQVSFFLLVLFLVFLC